jgi:hypothetical protein
MAINQYNISLIPRQSIIEKYGELPTQLFIDHDAWQRHFDTKDFDSEYDFEDAQTINWWRDRNVVFKDIELYIDSFTKPIEWSKNSTDSKSYGDNSTNDFFIGLTNEIHIDEFSCRIDVSNLDQNFINHILVLTKRLDCLLMDKKGNLFEPTFEKLVENIRKSNSFKFVSNPLDFFDKLSSGEIKPE